VLHPINQLHRAARSQLLLADRRDQGAGRVGVNAIRRSEKVIRICRDTDGRMANKESLRVKPLTAKVLLTIRESMA